MEINMKKYNLDSFQEKDLYSWDEIINKIEELEDENCSLKDKYNELIEDVQENYKKISYEEKVL